MNLMDTLMGRQNLQQLPPDQQQQARSEATRQFWLNTLLSGRGLAGGFAATQQVIPGIQAANQQQRMEQARQQAMVPTGNYLNVPRQGSQLDLIRGQMGDMIEDPQADAMTTEALQRRGQGTGIGGTGLTAQGQLTPEMELDPARFAELASQAMPASDVQGILRNFEAVRPKINDQGVMTDIRGRVIGSIPTFKDGTETQFDQRRGGFVSGAIPGYRAAQMSNYVPNLPEFTGWAQDAAGNIRAELVPGAVETMATTGTLRALTEAAGQTEEAMIGGVPGRIPRSAIVGSPQQFLQQLGQVRPNLPPDQAGAAPAAAGQQPGMPSGFVQTARTPQQQTLDEAANRLFLQQGERIQERANMAPERLFQSEEVYNAAAAIDPNALTTFAGTLTPYLRLIPGVGDQLAQFGTDYSLLRQRHSRGILRQFEGGAAKGNLNDREVRLFQTASWQMNDPKEIIQYIAATESALADKDLARMRFYEDFVAGGGNPAQFNTAWENAPENIRVYDHPMFVRFLSDRVNEAMAKPPDAKGNRPMPVLPPGHKLQQNDQGQFGIRNPDGRVIPIGQ
jgi:hypothetical protein